MSIEEMYGGEFKEISVDRKVIGHMNRYGVVKSLSGKFVKPAKVKKYEKNVYCSLGLNGKRICININRMHRQMFVRVSDFSIDEKWCNTIRATCKEMSKKIPVGRRKMTQEYIKVIYKGLVFGEMSRDGMMRHVWTKKFQLPQKKNGRICYVNKDSYDVPISAKTLYKVAFGVKPEPHLFTPEWFVSAREIARQSEEQLTTPCRQCGAMMSIRAKRDTCAVCRKTEYNKTNHLRSQQVKVEDRSEETRVPKMNYFGESEYTGILAGFTTLSDRGQGRDIERTITG